MKKIVLAGNPNVGKSVFFTRLSGIYAVSSNYPGTTVEISRSQISREGEKFELIDAPGTYALESDAEAERIAGKLIDEADIVVDHGERFVNGFLVEIEEDAELGRFETDGRRLVAGELGDVGQELEAFGRYEAAAAEHQHDIGVIDITYGLIGAFPIALFEIHV